METCKILTVLVLGLLLAAYNGLFILHRRTGQPRYSVRWHRVGWFIRAGLIVLLYPSWFWMLVYLNIAWTFYDVIINLYMGVPVFYQGKTAWFDKTFSRGLLFSLKGALLVFTLLYWIVTT